MPFDGCVVPEALRPYIDWVTGMAWPEGDPQGCFRMADACVVAAHQVVADTEAADPATARMVGELWDGAAQQEFVIHVQRTVGGRRADLVQRLIRAAISLNGVGVAIQHAQRMITLIVLFLLIALPLVIWQAPWALRPLLQIARMSAVQIRNTTVMYMIAFGAFGAALTFLTRYTQREGGRLDEIDGHELLISARDGAINGMLTGLLGGGLGRLATPALRAGVARAEATLGETLLARLTTTLPGQSLQYGIAGSATTAISMALDGRPLDWDLIVKGGTSAVLGVDGQHLLGPHLSPRHAEGGGASPPGRSSDGMPDAGPPLGHQAAGAPAPGVHRAEDGARPDGTPPPASRRPPLTASPTRRAENSPARRALPLAVHRSSPSHRSWPRVLTRRWSRPRETSRPAAPAPEPWRGRSLRRPSALQPPRLTAPSTRRLQHTPSRRRAADAPQRPPPTAPPASTAPRTAPRASTPSRSVSPATTRAGQAMRTAPGTPGPRSTT
ncbi:WXG100-like domain-containing protein [Nonomuraea recticatena]|uniref:WXG100-like domain-containing protein n=1 Tax=Nonomuraea recticatena TaxID=46178 RepID=UPI003607B9F9